jgi:dTDP-4-amino-4,6-dideoxygalactose transaminase
MYFGRIPRFSPSFSLNDALTSARLIARPPEDAPKVREFEQSFARFIGVKHAIMTPSARYAFYLILQAYDLGPGDEVVIPGLTYFAIPSIAVTAGVRPVFADVGLTTHVLDPAAFEAAITPKTRAVVPTHLYGTPCDMDAINRIAQAHGIKVIEDCAQSTGARYKGRRVGSLGDAAYYTFGLTKNMTTLTGAMVTTDDDAVAARIRKVIDAGTPAALARSRKEAIVGLAMKIATHPFVYPLTLHPAIVLGNKLGEDPIHERFGEPEVLYKELPDSFQRNRPRAVQAAVGLQQLARVEQLNGARSRNGRFLDEHLAHVPHLAVPSYPEGAEPIYMSFVVHHERRDDLMAALRKRGVDTTTGYMNDCSDHPLFPEFRRPCPNAATIKRVQLHIPVHPSLDDRDLAHMVEAVRSACLELARSA